MDPVSDTLNLADEIAREFLGSMTTAKFILYYGIALFGMFVQFAIKVDRAIKADSANPKNKFSWRKLITISSMLRLIASIGIIAIAVTNYEGLIAKGLNAEVPGPINIPGALLVGLVIDKLVEGLVGAGVNIAARRK